MRGRQDRPVTQMSLLVLLLALVPASADVYRWKDDDGQVHFSDEPPDSSGDSGSASAAGAETNDKAPAPRGRPEKVQLPEVNTSDPVPQVERDVSSDEPRRKVRRVILRRTSSGVFGGKGSINGESVTFLVDTGASHVSVPASVASRLGLERNGEVRYQTAAGTRTGYRTTLDTITLGGITVDNVKGSINPAVDNELVLLGMSFLRNLEFTQKQDRLILRKPVRR